MRKTLLTIIGVSAGITIGCVGSFFILKSYSIKEKENIIIQKQELKNQKIELKNQQDKLDSQNFNKKIDDFCAVLVKSESYYVKSRDEFGVLLRKGAEKLDGTEDGELILKEALKETDLSNFTKMAQKAVDNMNETLKIFADLYPRLNIASELKNNLLKLENIMQKNVLFINNADNGILSVTGIKNWTKQIDEGDFLIKSLNIECDKLINMKKEINKVFP